MNDGPHLDLATLKPPHFRTMHGLVVAQQVQAIGGLTQLESWLLGAIGTSLVGIAAFVRFVVVTFMNRHTVAFERACAAIEQVPAAILSLKTELVQSLGERIDRGTTIVVKAVEDQRLVEIRRHLSSRPDPAPESVGPRSSPDLP